jgi:hypothetical protein
MPPGNGAIDGIAVVRAIGHNRSDWPQELIQKWTDL